MADELKDALLEFVTELQGAGLEVFLAGGYGLYLRQAALLDTDERTYLPRDAWPRPRATADLDVFLPTEIVVDHSHMARVRKALDDLHYLPVPAKYLHFEREGQLGSVRIELLTGPVSPAHEDRVNVSGFRVRPQKSVGLHAYLTKEALDLELAPTALAIDGTRVLVPNAFSFLLMKLHAFRDRMNEARDDDGRQLGRHHALDVYRVIAMLTEGDESFVRARVAVRWAAEPVQAAAQIIAEHFADPTSIGVLRLREHALAGDYMLIGEFVELLGSLFSPSS